MGPSGSGKSLVGAALAADLRIGFIDVMQFTLRKSPWTKLSSEYPSIV